jgi:hypothetical protein
MAEQQFAQQLAPQQAAAAPQVEQIMPQAMSFTEMAAAPAAPPAPAAPHHDEHPTSLAMPAQAMHGEAVHSMPAGYDQAPAAIGGVAAASPEDLADRAGSGKPDKAAKARAKARAKAAKAKQKALAAGEPMPAGAPEFAGAPDLAVAPAAGTADVPEWASPGWALVLAMFALTWQLVSYYAREILPSVKASGTLLSNFDEIVGNAPLLGSSIGGFVGMVLGVGALALMLLGVRSGLREPVLQGAIGLLAGIALAATVLLPMLTS